MICNYRSCDQEFEIDPNQRGFNRKYCSIRCGNAERRLLAIERECAMETSEKQAVLTAREHAALHCAKYKECLDDAAMAHREMPCHKCDDKNMVPSIFRAEMYTSESRDAGEYPFRLPNHGRNS